MKQAEFPDSSNLQSARWVDNTLFVTFKRTGQTYEYPDVPEEKFDGLRDAASPGNFFATHIRPLYPHRTPEPVA